MKKMLLMATALVLAASAYAAPVDDTVGVKFEINDTLAINASSSKLDFGEVAVIAGEVQSPTTTLTVTGTDTTQRVILKVPSVIELKTAGNTAKVEFLSDLDGADGSTTNNGTDVEWIATNPFAAAKDEWTVDFGGKLNLLGTELSGEYLGMATITADYN